jgi:hypothetical protein
LYAEDLKTQDGTTYKNATITTVTAAYVSVMHEDGTARVMLHNLPEDLQKKYGYDPNKAVQHMTAEAQAQQRVAQQRQLAGAVAEFDKLSLLVNGTISQVADDGVLFRGSAYTTITSQSTTRVSDGTDSTTTTTKEKSLGGTGLIFIAGFTRGVVDGGSWTGRIWPAGTFSYESVGAGTKTIERWATTRELALKLLEK